MSSTYTASSEQTFSRPSNPVGYVAVLMAVVTGVLHLLAATNAIQFSKLPRVDQPDRGRHEGR